MHKSGFLLAFALIASTFAAEPQGGRYLLLATSRTSTMEKELNQAAADGYRLNSVIGGDVGGGEVITVMEKVPEKGRYGYKLLATNRTSTMQKELQEAADSGYSIVGDTARGEVMVILEVDKQERQHLKWEYKLLATSRTSTMQKEIDDASVQGYEIVALLRRGEVMAILRKKA
jgi:hypothetical protein